MTISVGHTDGATAGFGTFGLSNEFYGGVAGSLTSVVGSSNTTSNQSRDINQGRYDDILVPCQVIDDKIVDDYLNPINTKKQSIQQLGHFGTWVGAAKTYSSKSDASNAITPIYQNCHTSNDNEVCTVLGFGTAIGGVTVVVGAAVSQQTSENDPLDPGSTTFASGFVSISTAGGGYIVIDSVGGDFVSAGAGSSTGLGDVTVGGVNVGRPLTLNYTGMTKVREDVTMVTSYPNLEPPNDSVDNPYSGDTYPLLNSSTNGVGYAQTFFKNAIDTGAGGSPTIGGASNYGKVYTFDTSSASDVNTSIDDLDDEVVTLRSGMVSYTSSSNVLKPVKIGYAVNIWSYDRGNSIVGDINADYQSTINILNDPAIGGPY